MENHFIETFETEQDVLRKIEDLKTEGYDDNDMYVMARSDDQLSLVRGRTEVDYHAAEGTWMDRFATFLTGDEKVHKAFLAMGINEHESEAYYQKVQDGHFLLYVNKTYEHSMDLAKKDAFELSEKEKTGLQNEAVESPKPEPVFIEDETTEVLDDRQYEDPAFRKDKRNVDPISKPDEKNFI